MRIIDTHTHLYLDDYDADRQIVLQRAVDNGVTKLLLPAVDSQSLDALLSMVVGNPGVCFAMCGLHPTSVGENFESELAVVEKQLSTQSTPCVAVGEIGLDLFWDTSFLPQQTVALRRQLVLADEHSLPVVLHLRSAKKPTSDTPDAYELFFKIWDEHKANVKTGSRDKLNGVMHCFSGTVEQAEQAVAMGFLIGVGGVVTYKNSLLQQVVAGIPIESIVVETDSPYLAPVPYRGRRNESAYITEIVRKIADLNGMTPEEVAARTTQNAERLFSI